MRSLIIIDADQDEPTRVWLGLQRIAIRWLIIPALIVLGAVVVLHQ